MPMLDEKKVSLRYHTQVSQVKLHQDLGSLEGRLLYRLSYSPGALISQLTNETKGIYNIFTHGSIITTETNSIEIFILRKLVPEL